MDSLTSTTRPLKNETQPTSTTGQSTGQELLETGFNRLMQALKITKEFSSPCPPLQTAVGALLIALEAYEKYSDAMEALNSLLTRMEPLQNVIRKALEVEYDKCPKALKERLEAFASQVLSVVDDVKAIRSRRRIIRFINASDYAEQTEAWVKKLLWSIQSFILEGTIVLELTVHEGFTMMHGRFNRLDNGIKEVSEGIQGLRDDLDHKLADDPLRTRLRPGLEARFDHGSSIHVECHEGTRGEVLATLCSWLRPDDPRLSTLPEPVVPAESDRPILWVYALPGVAEPIQVAVAEGAFHSRIPIIIDALDECTDNSAVSTILASLALHISKLEPLWFLITSRREENITRGFLHRTLLENTQQLNLTDVRPDLTKRDIETFVRSRFEDIRRAIPGIRHSWPSRAELDNLLRLADVLFIYAATAMLFIADDKYIPSYTPTMSDEIDKSAMMSDSSHLGRCGWNDWKKRVMALCELKGALGHLNGSVPRPTYAETNETGTSLPLTDDQQTAMDKWDEKERYVRFMLKYNTTSEASAGIALEGTAANIWAQFLARYDATTSLDRINLVRKLEAMKLVPGSDIEAHVAAMCQAWQLALNAGAIVPASDFTVYLCNSLPASMEPLVAHLLDNEHPEYVMKQIKAIYTNSLMRAGIAATLSNTVTTTGAFANLSNNAFVAWSTIVCDWCGWNAHTRDRCYCPGGGMAGQQPTTWKTEPRPKKGSPCDVMMKEALAMIKPTSQPANVAHAANLTTSTSTTEAVSSTSATAASVTTHAFVTALVTETVGPKPLYDATQEPMTNIHAFADTGASHHYFTDRRHFTNYRTTSTMTGNAAKRGSTFEIAGIGDVSFIIRAEGRAVQILLRDVLHAPDLSANLVSVARIDRGGYRIEISEGRMLVYEKGSPSLCFTGQRTASDLYKIDIAQVLVDDETGSPQALATTAKADLATWHRRLGHPREQTVRDMVRTNAVKGIELVGKPPVGRCTDCLQGKHFRAPFYPATVETTVGERVYIDVMFFNTPSLGGGEIAFTYDDGGSSFLVTYVARTKTETESVGLLETYHNWLERQSGQKLLVVRTDNGGEFLNGAWTAYLRRTGIQHETTTPKTPQQNGVAERGHRTLGERVRTMLADSRLPEYLWGEALMCATYTKNLTASVRQGGKTPYERFYGTVPDISHLRVFGCLAWVKVPDDTRRKLDSKSVRGFLVGYTEDASYRVWLPQEGGPHGKVVRSRDVVFEEGPPHRTLTAEGELDYGGFVLPGNTVTRQSTESMNTTKTAVADGDGEKGSDDGDGGDGDVTLEGTGADSETDLCLGDFQAVVEPEPEIPRRSSRDSKPSRALLETREYEVREMEAKEKGEAWAGLTQSGVEAKYVAWLVELGDVASEVPEGLEGGRTPMNFREAEREPDIWRPAMKKEMDGLMNIKAWRLVPRTPEMNVVGCKWAYARKFDSEGKWKPKARLVAKGFHQIPGVDYFESHASVVRFESLRIICATVTYRDMEMRQDDIEKAYLNATPQKTVYMDQPPGFTDAEHPDHVCEVLRSLYGLMHAGNDWWQHLDGTYEQLGFSRSRADECVRACFDNGGLSITATYTDDITSAADDADALENVQRDLSARYKLSSGGELKFMLGVSISRDRENGTMRLSQRAYAERVLERFSLVDCNPVTTPLEPGSKLAAEAGVATEGEIREMETIPYREALGAIMYLAVATRPDLSHPVQLLSRFMGNPSYAQWKGLKRVLRYIKGTLDYGITYYGKMHTASTLQPVIYLDSSYADCTDTARSTQGHITIMAGGPVTWSSRRQDVVTLSSTEAEYIASVHAGQTAIWVAKFMDEIYLPISRPITLRLDSTGAESLAKRSANFTCVRHICVREFWLREVVRAGDISLSRIPGTENVADMLTKPLGPIILRGHINRLGLDLVRK
ncbi:hypothetical protein ACG7TL_007425 [Trametes sanguinea]